MQVNRDAVRFLAVLMLVAFLFTGGCSQDDAKKEDAQASLPFQPSSPSVDTKEMSALKNSPQTPGNVPQPDVAFEMGPPGASSGASIVTVVTPSGPKQVPGGDTFPDVFGHPIQLNDLHAIILGKGVPKRVKPKALFGEPLLYAALTLVGGTADPSSVPVVATLLSSPNKKTRGWARETLGAMGEQDAALRVPVEKAVSNVLRPRNRDVGQMPEWLVAACRQPLTPYQDASGTVHVDGETYDLDSVRRVLAEHIGKTKDEYVVLDRSPQTPRDLWLALEQLVEQLKAEPLGWESVALAESVWNALETEPSPAEEERSGDSEPLSPDARVVALYEAGKVGEARYALVSITGISYKGVTRRTAYFSLSRPTAGLEEALRHAHVVRLVRRCLTWERKMNTGELSRAIGADRSAIVTVAAQARETMQKVLDRVEWLKAEKPSAITPLMRERVDSARRELTLLVAEEIAALRDFGRFEQAKELEERYGSPEDTATPESPLEAAMDVLKQYETARQLS